MAGEINIVFAPDAEAVKRWDTHLEIHDDRIVVEFRHSSGASITTNAAGGFYWEWPVGDSWINGVAPTIAAALAAIKAAQEANQ
ncbi:hypothetical protein [Devosia alba]|uniref:hypothetical protein n=1 Tax=Devosia alba TaxID=3152360 RepID=UPI003262CD92